MYHQFKELADVDITKGPMEVGPTCHYMMGGIRVDAETGRVVRYRGFCRGRSRRRVARSEPPGRQFAFGFDGIWPPRGTGGCAGCAENRGAAISIARRSNRRSARCSRRLTARAAKIRTRFITICRMRCSGWSEFSARTRILRQALVELEKLKARAKNMRVEGSRLFNPGWHLSRDLRCMLTVSEACTHAALARKESRGAHSRLDFPKTRRRMGPEESCDREEGRRNDALRSSATAHAGGAGADSGRDEIDVGQVFRPEGFLEIADGRSNFTSVPGRQGERSGGGLQSADHRRHGCARRHPLDSGASVSRPRRALELQGREVRVVLGGSERQAAADVQDAHGLAADERADHRISR